MTRNRSPPSPAVRHRSSRVNARSKDVCLLLVGPRGRRVRARRFACGPGARPRNVINALGKRTLPCNLYDRKYVSYANAGHPDRVVGPGRGPHDRVLTTFSRFFSIRRTDDEINTVRDVRVAIIIIIVPLRRRRARINVAAAVVRTVAWSGIASKL